MCRLASTDKGRDKIYNETKTMIIEQYLDYCLKRKKKIGAKSKTKQKNNRELTMHLISRTYVKTSFS
jgi:hypothetical protein